MLSSWLQSLVAHVDVLELPLNALKENAAELDQIISESSKAVIGHAVSSLWQRWTRLRCVARAQERALEDTAREWRNFTERVSDNTGDFLVLLYMVPCYSCAYIFLHNHCFLYGPTSVHSFISTRDNTHNCHHLPATHDKHTNIPNYPCILTLRPNAGTKVIVRCDVTPGLRPVFSFCQITMS